MNFTRIKETCIYVHDLEAVKTFYHEVLLLDVIHYESGKHLFLRVGDSVLLFFNPADSRMKDSPPGHFAEGKQHFAFEVPAAEYASSKAEILAKRIVISDTVTWKNGTESFYFEDPAGNVVEIVPDKGMWD
jgi:catechol-2,3-dioxygenase